VSAMTAPGYHSDDLLHIIPRIGGGTVITLMPGFRWNGATFAPDFRRVLPGSAIHDALYERRFELADEWHTPESLVRHWADEVFNEVNRHYGFGYLLKRIYYRAVRRLGWIGGVFSR
jgi:hypothetical protein